MNEFVTKLLEFHVQLKIFHWQTKSYARHNAFGQTYDAIEDSIDDFIEVHMGKYGRFQLGQDSLISLSDLSDASLNEFLNTFIEFLNSLSNSLEQTDTDLLNIRDEILGKVNKLKFLLTLK